MTAKKEAPHGGNRYGAINGCSQQKHLVPIVTHYTRPRKRVHLVWTPANIALLILLAAVAVYLIVQRLTADPLAGSDLLISMGNSVFRV